MISTTAKMWSKLSRPHLLFSFLLVLSFSVRLIGSLVIGLRPDPSYLDIGDEREYYEQARAILQGEY